MRVGNESYSTCSFRNRNVLILKSSLLILSQIALNAVPTIWQKLKNFFWPSLYQLENVVRNYKIWACNVWTKLPAWNSDSSEYMMVKATVFIRPFSFSFLSPSIFLTSWIPSSNAVVKVSLHSCIINKLLTLIRWRKNCKSWGVLENNCIQT